MINNKDLKLIKRNHKLVLGTAAPVLIVLGLTIVFLYVQMEPYGRFEDWTRVESRELEYELGQLVWTLIGAFGLIWSAVVCRLVIIWNLRRQLDSPLRRWLRIGRMIGVRLLAAALSLAALVWVVLRIIYAFLD